MPEEVTLLGQRTLTKEAVATFAALTGDYSRIHLDHLLGRSSASGRGFAHGLLGASWALGAMTLYAPNRVGCGEPTSYISAYQVRFEHVVGFDDTLAFRFSNVRNEKEGPRAERFTSAFEVLNQDTIVATRGSVTRSGPLPDARFEVAAVPEVWPGGRWNAPDGASLTTAEDLLAHGPRGGLSVRTLTEADVVNFTGFTGELNPLYLNAVFAEQALFGRRTVPPMLCFSLGFAVWLREFLRLRGGAGKSTSAGHLGDRWQFVAPVYVGDTLEVRHRPLSVRRTRTDPGRGIMTFGLQLVNQKQYVVQQAEVDMMLDMRVGSPDA